MTPDRIERLKRARQRLYSETRFSNGDEMRDLAQSLDDVLEEAEAECGMLEAIESLACENEALREALRIILQALEGPDGIKPASFDSTYADIARAALALAGGE